MENYKIIALMGEAGSGKDTLLKSVLTLAPDSLHEIINCTTRPIRENEEDGVDYLYISEHEFKQRIMDGTMMEYAEFNNWFYGTLYNSLDEAKVNIGVFSPAAIEGLITNERVDLEIFYVYVPSKVRLLRQLNREKYPDVDEIIRRYNADKKDFSTIGHIPYTELLNASLLDHTQSLHKIIQAMDNFD